MAARESTEERGWRFFEGGYEECAADGEKCLLAKMPPGGRSAEEFEGPRKQLQQRGPAVLVTETLYGEPLRAAVRQTASTRRCPEDAAQGDACTTQLVFPPEGPALRYCDAPHEAGTLRPVTSVVELKAAEEHFCDCLAQQVEAARKKCSRRR